MPYSDRDWGELMRRALRQHEAERDAAAAVPRGRDDFLLGHIALEWGLLDSQALLDGLRDRQELAAAGEDTDLGALLLRRGLIDAPALERLRRECAARAQRSSLFHRYEVQGQLGEGGMAVVYRALDREINRPVALKVLRPDASANEALRQRFRREAQAAGGLTHPNLVKVYDAGEEDGRMYIVMELIDGQPLTSHPAAREPDVRTRVGLIEKAARGVEAAHRKGIVHRDLKPANILVGRDGEPRVSDFGLAHVAGSDLALTRTGLALGTPLYMAPEQVRGRSEAISPRTDVYALGAILYELLGGRPPHVGATVSEVYSRILEDDPEPLRQLGAQAPSDLEAIVLKALAKDPAARYDSAGAFADDLRRFLNDRPVEARRARFMTRALRTVARRRRSAAPVAAILVLGLGLGAWLIVDRLQRAHRVRAMVAEASTLEQTGTLNDARDRYRAAMQLDGGCREAVDGVARTTSRIEAQQHDLNEALALLEAARAPLDEAARVLYKRDRTYGDLAALVEKAEPLIGTALKKAPNLALAHYVSGRAAAIRGYPAVAEACWRRAARLDPNLASARYQLGRLLLEGAHLAWVARGRGESRAAGRAEGNALTQEASAHIEAALSRGLVSDDARQQQFALAMKAHLAKNRAEVTSICDEAIASLGDREGAEDFYWLRCFSLSPPEARLSLEQAIGIRPHYPMARYCLALLRYAQDPPGALADLDDAIAFSPGLSTAYGLRSVVRLRMGNAAAAIEDAETVLKLEPDKASGRCLISSTWLLLGDTPRALEAAEEAVRIEPDSAEARYARGRVLRAKGDLPGALADLTRSIELDAGAGEAHYERARLYLEQKDQERAMTDLTQALQLTSPSEAAFTARCLYWRAIVAGRLERWDIAATDARRALELNLLPQDYEAQLRAILARREGKND